MDVAEENSYKPNLAIRYFQNIVKYKIFMKEILNADIHKLFQYISNVSLQIQHNFNQGILTQEKYSKLMNNVEYLVNDCKSLPQKVTFATFLNISTNELKKRINLYMLALQKLVKLAGTNTCTQIFNILLENNWDKNLNKEYLRLIEFYDKFFSPICCNLIDNLETMSSIIKDNITILPFVKKYYESFEPTDEDITFSEKIYGADVYFQFGERLLFVRGVFSEDNINIKEIGTTFSDKYKNLMRRVDYLTLPEVFKTNYINQLSIRDFLSLSINEIINLVKNGHNIYNKYKKMDVDDLMHKFNNSSETLQRTLLTLFIIADEKLYMSTKPTKQQFISNIIYESLHTSDPLYASNIFKSLHWTVQKKFSLNASLIYLQKHKTLNLQFDSVSYENKIALLKDVVPDNILKRALEKYKESLGSKESSVKAQQYLDGFLKIPFGNYKKEPMLSYIDEFKEIFGPTIIKSISRIKTSYLLSSATKSKLLDVLEVYNDDINTDATITDFLMSVDLCINSIDISSPKRPMLADSEHTNTDTDTNTDSDTNTDNDTDTDTNDAKDGKDNANVVLSTNGSEDDSEDDSTDSYYEPKSPKIQITFNRDKDEFARVTLELRSLIDKWRKYKTDRIDYIKDVRKILDGAVHGHQEAKREIERLIAQWINGDMKGTVLGLHGCPGIGKTELCKNGIAKCLKDEHGNPRPMGFLAVGGASDGATLEGHSYTYLGSMWGRIVDILMDTKCMNPIFYIDEIDKVSKTEHGREIIGILTHMTDFTQNSDFTDRYFSGIPFDLSKALFIFSYNERGFDRVLEDRITEISLSPLSSNEKVHIQQKYVIPRSLKTVGFKSNDLVFSKDVVKFIIDTYTYEGGVRKLNEKIEEIVKELNLQKLNNPSAIKLPYKLTIPRVKDLLKDKHVVEPETVIPKPVTNTAHGLYATSLGVGGLIKLQVLKYPCNNNFDIRINGSAQDVMKQSTSSALSMAWHILSIKAKKKINKNIEDEGGFGLNFLMGDHSTPIEGPSASVATTLLILGFLTNTKISNTVALTGEIDMSGNSTKIGGLDSKIMGAQKGKVKTVIAPMSNKLDYTKFIKKLDKDELKNLPKVRFVNTIYECFEHIYVKYDKSLFNIPTDSDSDSDSDTNTDSDSDSDSDSE